MPVSLLTRKSLGARVMQNPINRVLKIPCMVVLNLPFWKKGVHGGRSSCRTDAGPGYRQGAGSWWVKTRHRDSKAQRHRDTKAKRTKDTRIKGSVGSEG